MSPTGRVAAWVIACLCAAVAVGGGCSHLPGGVFVSEGFSSPGTPYGDALERHTRKAELYEGVGTVAKGWATWESPELRRALAEASSRAFGAREPVEAPGGAAPEVAGGAWTFHLALYTPKRQWNDLESVGSLWKARLAVGGGADVSPLRVEVIPKTEKARVQYPYVTRWTREYRLVFPVPEGSSGASPPSLLLAGPLGQMRFQF